MVRNPIIIPTVNNPYGYIYKTTCIINGYKYIGQHSKPEFDKKYLGSGVVLQKAIKKYGKENFISEPIDWAESKEELDQKEIWWISKLGALYSEEYYNLAPGGDGAGVGKNNPMYGTHRTQEQKDKQSRLMRGSNNPMYGIHRCGENSPMYGVRRFGTDNPNYGNRWTDEQKLNLSKKLSGRISSFKGKHHSKTSKKLLSKATIRQLQTMGHPMKGKFHTEESKRKMSESHKLNSNGANNSNSKPIVQLTLEGCLVNTFSYMKEASKFGFKTDSISECCKGKKQSYKGFRWMYLEDYKAIGGIS